MESNMAMKKAVKKLMMLHVMKMVKRILQRSVKFVSGNLIQFVVWNHILKCVGKV